MKGQENGWRTWREWCCINAILGVCKSIEAKQDSCYDIRTACYSVGPKVVAKAVGSTTTYKDDSSEQAETRAATLDDFLSPKRSLPSPDEIAPEDGLNDGGGCGFASA